MQRGGAEKPTMSNSSVADATLAKLFTCLPVFRRWTNEPLDPELHKIIESVDEQSLLSIAVFALSRAIKESPGDDPDVRVGDTQGINFTAMSNIILGRSC